MISFKTCIMANFLGFSGNFHNKLTVNQYNQPPTVLRYHLRLHWFASSKCGWHKGIPKPYWVNNIVIIIILLLIVKLHPSRVDTEFKSQHWVAVLIASRITPTELYLCGHSSLMTASKVDGISLAVHMERPPTTSNLTKIRTRINKRQDLILVPYFSHDHLLGNVKYHWQG